MAWFHACEFINNTAVVDGEEVSVSGYDTRVYASGGGPPRIYNLATDSIEGPIIIGPATGRGGGESVFAGATLPKEGDSFFVTVTAASVRFWQCLLRIDGGDHEAEKLQHDAESRCRIHHAK